MFEQQVKYRVVGVTVIILFFLAFLPFILSHSSHDDVDIAEFAAPSPPEKPVAVVSNAVDSSPFSAPTVGSLAIFEEDMMVEPVMAVLPVELDQEAVVVETIMPELMEQPSSPAPKELAVNITEGWSVQLGSFASQENAQRLTEALQEKGYQAYTKVSVAANGDSLTRVLVGPEVERRQANHLLATLAEQTGLAGWVVKETVG